MRQVMLTQVCPAVSVFKTSYIDASLTDYLLLVVVVQNAVYEKS